MIKILINNLFLTWPCAIIKKYSCVYTLTLVDTHIFIYVCTDVCRHQVKVLAAHQRKIFIPIAGKNYLAKYRKELSVDRNSVGGGSIKAIKCQAFKDNTTPLDE
uniref:Uncharacterized protein n=1 Tax=Ceratitis capitata TaxID=7213 RepID=W8AJW9_CERCA